MEWVDNISGLLSIDPPNNPKGVVFHHRRTTDAPKKTLLHSTFETNNGDFWRRLYLVFRYQTLDVNAIKRGLPIRHLRELGEHTTKG